MNFRQVLRRLKDEGWEIKDQNSSHVHLTHFSIPGKLTLVKHGKKDIKIGTLKSIEKQARLKF